MAAILLGSFIYLNLFFDHFEDFYIKILFEKHKEVKEKLREFEIENLPVLIGEPQNLGNGILENENEIKLYPSYLKVYWEIGKKYIKDFKEPKVTKPIKGKDLYFSIAFSTYRDKIFVSFFDSTLLGFLQRNIRILSIFVISTGILLPLYLYLFLKRAGKLYNALLKEAKESPLSEICSGDPVEIIETLKKANEELRILLKEEKDRAIELEILSKTLSKNIPTGLIITNSNSEIIEANGYAVEKFNLRDFKGLKIEEKLTEYQNVLKIVRESIEDKKPMIRHTIKEKEKIYEFTIAPLLKNDSFLGTLILFQDLTELKKLEEEIKEKENLASLGTFSAGIAHEFRNSISTIIGYAKLINLSKEDEEIKKYLNSLLEEAKHINDVITSFLEYTRIQKIQRERVEILNLIENSLEPLKEKYRKVKFIIKGGKFNLNLDPGLFIQALRAIIDNSCYEQREGEIIISLKKENGEFLIEIKDFGPGMDEETVKKIFIPFFSTKPKGIGLGLPLAQKIIMLHNGRIVVNSKKGEGTTFKIYLREELLQNYTE